MRLTSFGAKRSQYPKVLSAAQYTSGGQVSHETPASTEPLPIPQTVVEQPVMTSKLTALADLAATAPKDIDAAASASMDRLTKAKAKALDATAKIDGISAQIESGVAAVENMANQLSNGGPPLS